MTENETLNRIAMQMIDFIVVKLIIFRQIAYQPPSLYHTFYKCVILLNHKIRGSVEENLFQCYLNGNDIREACCYNCRKTRLAHLDTYLQTACIRSPIRRCQLAARGDEACWQEAKTFLLL